MVDGYLMVGQVRLIAQVRLYHAVRLYPVPTSASFFLIHREEEVEEDT